MRADVKDVPIDKLKSLIPMLSSPLDGEVVAAARAIERTLKRFGCDWHDLVSVIGPAAAPQPAPKPEFNDINKTRFTDAPWRETAKFCMEREDDLSPREYEFVDNLLTSWRGRLTEKQAKWLASIAVRLGA
jgi:hypothetical protein